MTTKEGDNVEIYDTVTADSVEVGDQVLIEDDPIEVSKVIDSGDAIMVKGYSHLTGDAANYILKPDSTVGLWSV